MAMLMARLASGNHDIITLRNAYHGLSGNDDEGACWACPTRADPHCPQPS